MPCGGRLDYLRVHDDGEPGGEAGDGGVDEVLARIAPADRWHLAAVRDSARQLKDIKFNPNINGGRGLGAKVTRFDYFHFYTNCYFFYVR